MFRGKKYKESAKQIDRSVQYESAEAMALICKTASAKFDETVELHVKLGVDSRHADQQVRGAIVLPNGTGKTARVLVFAKGDAGAFTWMLYELFGGGLMLGAFFMATDYVTSPCTQKGELVYGIGCGLLTVFIRYFGGYPEGVSYAILIMNVCAWLIDKVCKPARYGVTAEMRAAAKAKAKEGASK